MRLSNKYGGLQFFAPSLITIYVNDSAVTLQYKDGADTSWSINASLNTTIYSIDSDNRVVWNDGKFLAYNGVIVLGSDVIIPGGSYTTVGGGGSTMSKSYDLSTSSKWANLASGNHTVKIRAKASGYSDSPFSNEVTVTKAASTYTLEAGTYKWVDSPTDLPKYDVYSPLFSFTSNDSTYQRIQVQYDSESYWSISYEVSDTNINTAFSTDPDFEGWTKDAYKTITLATPQTVSAEFYEWAITSGNLVKQESETWVLNETLYYESVYNFPDIQFLSDGVKYNRIYVRGGAPTTRELRYFYYNYEGSYVDYRSVYSYSSEEWSNESYRTITFQTPPTGDLLTWLQANGTKQGGGGVTETDITSTVSAFNINLKLNDQNSQTLQSTLGGGNGTYAVICDVADANVNGSTLSVYSNATDSMSGNVTVTSGSKSLQIPVNITYEYCLTGDTMITMFDGTEKRIDQIELGDLVLSLDKDGNKVPGYVYYSDSHCNNMGQHYDRFVFSDGTEMKVVHRHRFFNVNEQKFVHLDNFYEGDVLYKVDGTTVTLTEKHYRDYEGEIPHYTIFCEHNTYFANGLLCGNRFSDPVKINVPATYNVYGEEYMPIVLKLPETFSGYTDAWLDQEKLDLMLTKDGKTINYYQIGYSDVYAACYKKADDDYDLDNIETNWTKICDLPKASGTNRVDGKEFDCIVIYVKRPARGGSQYSTGVSLHEQYDNDAVNMLGGEYTTAIYGVLSIPQIEL